MEELFNTSTNVSAFSFDFFGFSLSYIVPSHLYESTRSIFAHLRSLLVVLHFLLCNLSLLVSKLIDGLIEIDINLVLKIFTVN